MLFLVPWWYSLKLGYENSSFNRYSEKPYQQLSEALHGWMALMKGETFTLRKNIDLQRWLSQKSEIYLVANIFNRVDGNGRSVLSSKSSKNYRASIGLSIKSLPSQ